MIFSFQATAAILPSILFMLFRQSKSLFCSWVTQKNSWLELDAINAPEIDRPWPVLFSGVRPAWA
jgi:hypothetical protein